MLVKCVGFVLINLVKWFQKEFAHYVLFSCHLYSRSKIRHPQKKLPRAHTKVRPKIKMFTIIRKYYKIVCLRYEGGNYIITPFAIHHFQITSYHGTASKRLRESFNPNYIHVRKQIHLMFHIGFCWILDT